MKIAVLSNNFTNCELKGEHGLSLYAEYNGKKSLIDSGLGDLVIRNAQQMNVDLSQVDFVILTHGHYDHTDGLPFFNFNGQKIYTHTKLFKERYSLKPQGFKFNGINWKKEELQGKCEIVQNNDFVQISKGIYLSGSIPHVHPAPENNFFEKQDINSPDIVEDEQLIIFEQSDGLIVVSGCTHYGINNMTDFIKNKFPGKKVKALFAALHTMFYSPKQCLELINYLSDCGLYQRIYALHCTGEQVGLEIQNRLNGKLVSVGDIFEFED